MGGSNDKLDYFFTGQYLQNQLGVEPPTSGPSAYHDQTYQGQGFSYLSYFLNPTTRLSLITGFALNHFQIPNNPDQPQVFDLAGVPFYPSANVNERQLEQNYYGVLALQGTIGTKFDYQLSGFSRYSTLSFYPDQTGDLIYNGAASQDFPQQLVQRPARRQQLSPERSRTPCVRVSGSAANGRRSTIMK